MNSPNYLTLVTNFVHSSNWKNRNSGFFTGYQSLHRNVLRINKVKQKYPMKFILFSITDGFVNKDILRNHMLPYTEQKMRRWEFQQNNQRTSLKL